MKYIGPYSVDWRSGEVIGASGKIRLTPIQISVLRLLVEAKGKVVVKNRFHDEIWPDHAVEDGNLSQTVFLLRRALGKLPNGDEIIETVSGKGYCLAAGALEHATPALIDNASLNKRFGMIGDQPYRMLLEAVEDYAIYMLDVSGRIITWNKGAERVMGFADAEVIGRHYSIFFVPEDVSAFVPEREMSIAATHGRCKAEGWRTRKDGERFWVGYALTPVRSPNGAVVGFAKVVKDLTEQKRHEDVMARAEAQLRRERDRLRAIAESSLDAVFICEAVTDERGSIVDFRFTYLNQNVENLVAIPSEQLLGGRMCELLPINLENGLFEAYKHVALTGKPLLTEILISSDLLRTNWVRIQAVRLDAGLAITASDLNRQTGLRTHSPVLRNTWPEERLA